MKKQPSWLVEAADRIVRPSGGGPAILVIDIETTPVGGYTWGHYKQNVLKVTRPSYILCHAYSWYGSGKVQFSGIIDDPGFTPDTGYNKPRKSRDRWVVGELFHLLDQADVVIAHNGDKFDIRRINAQFMRHKLGPTSPINTIDTLKEVRRYADFGSHRLAEISVELTDHPKLNSGGLETWFAAMAGESWAWDKMEKYNIRDVEALTDAYTELMPWIGQPGRNNPGGNQRAWGMTCPKMGCKGTKLVVRGHRVTATGLRYTQYRCSACGGYSRARYAEREDLPPSEKIK